MLAFDETNLQAFKNLKKPDAIIFDWDNTLVDTWSLIHFSINKVMTAMNKELWTIQKIRDTIHKSMRESFPEIFGKNWQEAGEIYKKSYHECNLQNIRLLDNSLELLQTINDLKIPQFLVSNKIGTTLRKEVAELKLENLFFSIIGAQDAENDKPNRAPVDFALMSSNIDLNKHHIWFVGDTIADVECAYNIGACPIVYGFEKNQISKTIDSETIKHGFKKSGAIPVYFNHQELIDILRNF